MQNSYRKPILSFLLLLFIIVSAYSQDKVSKKSKWFHVNAIKEGILLVRLNNNDRQVYELNKAGYDQKAKQYEKENTMVNDEIIKSFSNLYNFSEYYFYNANDAKLLPKGKFEGILKDKDGNNVAPEFGRRTIFTADFGYATAPGSTETYNKKGFLIRQIGEDEFIRLASDLFYFGAGIKENDPMHKIDQACYKLNSSFVRMMKRLEKKPQKKEKRLNKFASKF